ncbi:hypothetical protein CBM2589_B120186 [Cupriavidus taiwanensis]|uniref:Uncharacterized protein n=1 Tax=Cupriavidus taiwanensis TaxID=164546 RepID=A0A375BGQ2_9BURK|nr:hypothetical protein CBM2589_B120186 [Cupriavidus taiwanensis]
MRVAAGRHGGAGSIRAAMNGAPAQARFATLTAAKKKSGRDWGLPAPAAPAGKQGRTAYAVLPDRRWAPAACLGRAGASIRIRLAPRGRA